jgi:osmotically-inducible protein OsmY
MLKRSLFFLLASSAALAMTLSGCNKLPTPTTLPAEPVAAVAAGNVSDIDISEHVKTALLQNAMLKGFDIAVVTLKGDVRLMGTVDTQAQMDEAVKIARATDGAHAIHNELMLKK